MSALRIAIAGLGTVGSGVLHVVRDNAALIAERAGRAVEVVAVSARRKTPERMAMTEDVRWLDDPLALAALPDVDVVVEVMGGADGAARGLCEAALTHGKHVVTANKALLATHGAALAALAEQTQRCLMFEAAVAGGLPVIKALREALTGNRILAVRGILNGTCNYILTRMRDAGLDFATALKEAQDRGYAEADPAADVDGHDTAHKLALLASLAFAVKPDGAAIPTEGIRRVTPMDLDFADDLGCRIKLLGVARAVDGALECSVAPCLVAMTSPLARTDDVLNAVEMQGNAVGTLTLTGRGAGGAPTASAVVSDIVDLARGYAALPFGRPVASLGQAVPVAPDRCMGRWYVRLMVRDRVGVVAEIGAILRACGVSIQSLIQRGQAGEAGTVPLILTTHEVAVSAMDQALTSIAELDFVEEKPFCLRIETGE